MEKIQYSMNSCLVWTGSVKSVRAVASSKTLGNSSPNNSTNHPRHMDTAIVTAKATEQTQYVTKTWKRYSTLWTHAWSVKSVRAVASSKTLGNSSPNNSTNHPRHMDTAIVTAKATEQTQYVTKTWKRYSTVWTHAWYEQALSRV